MLKPTFDRVVVRPDEDFEKTESGLFIPGTAQERPSRGQVVAVGPGRRSETGQIFPVCLNEGDNVLYGKASGTEIKIAGQTFIVMPETDVLGVF